MDYKDRVASVRQFYKLRGRMPSVSEVAEVIGVASKNTAVLFIQKLCDDGFASKDVETGRLVPGWRLRELPLLGLVAAGFPAPGDEQYLHTTTLDDLVVRNPESTFLLRVTGDSMKDAGILDGDYVVVERAISALPGAIVVAEIDGDFTVKYLHMENGRPYLKPANSEYPDLLPEGEFRVHALVVGVVRSLRI